MDTINVVINAITTVGFPIVCCGALMYYQKYTRDKDSEQLKQLSVSHAEEMKTMADALNNNTIVLQKLCDKLDSEVNVNGKK
nr:MAG TPA: YvrJ protein family protein [Caudoviricetes sp.]